MEHYFSTFQFPPPGAAYSSNLVFKNRKTSKCQGCDSHSWSWSTKSWDKFRQKKGWVMIYLIWYCHVSTISHDVSQCLMMRIQAGSCGRMTRRNNLNSKAFKLTWHLSWPPDSSLRHQRIRSGRRRSKLQPHTSVLSKVFVIVFVFVFVFVLVFVIKTSADLQWEKKKQTSTSHQCPLQSLCHCLCLCICLCLCH